MRWYDILRLKSKMPTNSSKIMMDSLSTCMLKSRMVSIRKSKSIDRSSMKR